MTRLAASALRFYRAAFALLRAALPFQSECRHWPTCSRYAEDAFRQWGFRKGLALSFRRILRCHPFSARGYDPVPSPAPSRGFPHV